MAETTGATEVPYLKPMAAAKRVRPNVSGGWIVMLLSGLIAMAIFFFATGQSGQRYSVSVIKDKIAPGETIKASELQRSEVFVDQSQLDKLVRFDDITKYDGWIATAPLEAGDLLSKSSLREPAASDGLRSMSIPVERSHAVGGDLKVGDRVDIIDAQNAPAAYVAQNIAVVSVNTGGTAALGATSDFSVTVAVDSDQAIRLSSAIKANKFDVVKSTGAAPIAGDRPPGVPNGARP